MRSTRFVVFFFLCFLFFFFCSLLCLSVSASFGCLASDALRAACQLRRERTAVRWFEFCAFAHVRGAVDRFSSFELLHVREPRPVVPELKEAVFFRAAYIEVRLLFFSANEVHGIRHTRF